MDGYQDLLPLSELSVPIDGTQTHKRWNELHERRLANDTMELLNDAGWPVARVVRMFSAGDSLHGQDTVQFITPGGKACTALLIRHNNIPYVDGVVTEW